MPGNHYILRLQLGAGCWAVVVLLEWAPEPIANWRKASGLQTFNCYLVFPALDRSITLSNMYPRFQKGRKRAHLHYRYAMDTLSTEHWTGKRGSKFM